ncbi:MAG TPA: di-trans,poly-cis-decaprenylcistransferase [Longimicrobiales bacterium]|nr:di-trans,poly-cis-decaprenylcistransferase [Longimicrobiales bacterium]
MTQSKRVPAGIHAALIMDGNGRWATRRGLPRLAGHRAGADAVRRVVEAAPELGIGVLTLYAFSSDNWRRPPEEVRGLFRLFRLHLRSERLRMLENGVRLRVVGRRDRLPRSLRAAIEEDEALTAGGDRLLLRLAIDYSARDLLACAAAGLPPGAGREVLAERLGAAMHADGPALDVDLLIRTGGEQRLSDFLLWECAYAELVFSSRLWPEFGRDDLAAAVADFHGRERRFGALPERAAS